MTASRTFPWGCFRYGLGMRKPFLRHHDSTLFPPSALQWVLRCDFESWLQFSKAESFKARRRQIFANQAHLFWAIWSDVLCPTTALFVKFIQSPVIRVFLLKAHFFKMITDVYVKVICGVHDHDHNLTAGGMICEMEWNRLSRTSITVVGTRGNPDDSESYYSHLICFALCLGRLIDKPSWMNKQS